MTDIHSHLLFNIDDGSKSINESVEILRKMKSIGYDNVILTPHYIRDSKYNSSKKNNIKLMKELKRALVENNIEINLYLGNEIYIDDNIDVLLKNNEVSSLNDTNYLLIELPISGEYSGYEEIFKDLMDKGFQVILAHPERYLSFQKDFSRIYELENLGVLFQSNLLSILGGYGRSAKKLMKRLLKEKKISFLATDIHHMFSDNYSFSKVQKKLLKYLSEKELSELVDINSQKIIMNK